MALFCFFKQKTAYEGRISDWSSDVCSSDLLLAHCDDLLLIAMDGDAALLRTLKRARPKSVWLAAVMPRAGHDARRLAERQHLSAATGVPLLATNDALYATAAQRPLHDIITCIRERSEEHTSELQSLMRISYAVFCL